MKSRRASALAAVTAVAALTAGCSTSENSAESDPQPLLSTVSAPSADEAADEEVVTETVTKPNEQPEKSKKDKKCASLPKDPREQYPDGEAPGRMPAKDWEDYNFWIGNIDNYYDPCAPVSWVIFRGGLGDSEKPAQTGASMTNGIAFYVYGEPVDEMTLFTRVENAVPDADENVIFSWGERTRSTAEGITAHYEVTLEPRNDTMVPLSGDIEEFNEHWNEPKNKFLLGHYD